jgi:hypothetical protein
VIHRARHIGEQIGIAVAAAGDQRTDLDPFGLLGPGAEHRPAFEMRAVVVAAERIEVIPVEGDIDARVLRAQYGIAQESIVCGVLGL